MSLESALLDSWDRQAKMVESVASLVNESNRKTAPTPDGWSLDVHLAHIHQVRKGWLAACEPYAADSLADAYMLVGENDWQPLASLDALKGLIAQSAQTLREALTQALKKPDEPYGPYDSPVLFLQHMVWHEGWHVGLILTGLRQAGSDPGEPWEEEHIWTLWRGPEES